MSNAGTTRWVGWGVFAGVFLFVNGAFSILQGIVALIGPDTYYARGEESLFIFDVEGWGWWTLILGALTVLVAVALLAGQTWARVIAVILAVFSIAAQLLLIPAQPFWSLAIIAVDLLIIYALTVHGDEMRDA